MSNELTLQQPKASALAAMASRFSVEPAKLLDTLKNTAFKGANDAQMMALVIVANEHGMNPFTKEIYAFPDKSGGIVPVIGVDGWYRKMNEHPQFDGIETSYEHDAKGDVVSCTATIHRKDRSHPITTTEYVSECKRNTDPWNKQPRRMIRHRAIIQGVRIAFGLSALDPEDAERMQERDVTPTKSAPVPVLKAINAPEAAIQETQIAATVAADIEWDGDNQGLEPEELGKEGA